MRLAFSTSPTCSSIMTAERNIAIGFTIGGLSSAYLGAEPWVGSNTATSSPMLPDAANPNPPIRPANASEITSPKRFEATTTPYSSGFFVSHIVWASMFVDHNEIPGYSFATDLASSSIIPEVSRSTLGFSQMVTDLYPYFFAQSNAALQILRAAARVTIRTEIARSAPETDAKGLNLE